MVLHWENLSTECYLCYHFILLREWMRTDDDDDDCPQPNEVRGRGESPARDGAFKPLFFGRIRETAKCHTKILRRNWTQIAMIDSPASVLLVACFRALDKSFHRL
jgi:hypothetical protein